MITSDNEIIAKAWNWLKHDLEVPPFDESEFLNEILISFSGNQDDMVTTWRRFFPETKSNFRFDLIIENTQKEIDILIVKRLFRKFRCLYRRNQMETQANLKFRPYWETFVFGGKKIPGSCQSFIGLIKRNSDPFWTENYPPHRDFECNCEVRSLSERDLISKGVNIPE